MINRIMNQSITGVLALLLFLTVISLSTFIYELYVRSLSVSNWMRIDQLLVEDSSAPRVTMVRTVYVDLIGTWSVEVHRVTNRVQQVCQGSGTSTYTQVENKTLNLDLRDFSGDQKCNLSPGRYVLNVAWTLSNTQGISKVLTAQSNTFVVPDNKCFRC